ncbi:MAG: hypothetical protein ACK55I_05930, partial [bacterium]
RGADRSPRGSTPPRRARRGETTVDPWLRSPRVGEEAEDPGDEPPAARDVGMPALPPDGDGDLCRGDVDRCHPEETVAPGHRRVDETGLDVGDDDGELPGRGPVAERLE